MNQNRGLKKNHICGSFKSCRYCYLPEDVNHLCSMKIEKNHTFLNRLAICQLQLSIDNDVVMALLLREEFQRCNFTKYSFFHCQLDLQDSIEPNFELNYTQEKFPFPKRNSPKTSFDYNNNLTKLANEMHSIEKTLLQHFLQEDNFRATYIILDEENNGLVRIILK